MHSGFSGGRSVILDVEAALKKPSLKLPPSADDDWRLQWWICSE